LFKNFHSVTHQPLWNILVGTEAGIMTVFLTNPLWVVNSRQITDHHFIQKNETNTSTSSTETSTTTTLSIIESKDETCDTPTHHHVIKHTAHLGFWQTFDRVLRTEGISGLYSGLGPALALVSSPALTFYFYEWIKKIFILYRLRNHGSKNLKSMDIFLVGALSKIFATLLTYPIQTIKAHLQKSDSEFSNMYTCAIHLLNTDPLGYVALYRGLSSKLLQTTLTAAFLQMWRDTFVKLLTRKIK
jgi:adenine nucleotide transporter 17